MYIYNSKKKNHYQGITALIPLEAKLLPNSATNSNCSSVDKAVNAVLKIDATVM